MFPEAVARLISEAAASIGCDVGIGAGLAIAVAGGVIGPSVRLWYEGSRYYSATIFHVGVGIPGDGKSPFLDYVAAPLRSIEQDLARQFKKQIGEYIKLQEKFKNNEKNKKKDKEKNEEIDTEPERPKGIRLIVEDMTMESFYKILSANPRGLASI